MFNSADLLPLPAEASALLGLEISPEQMRSFETYARLLLEWNERHNLTAIRTLDEIRVKHFLDGLTCLQVIGPAQPGKMIDVGTGAGFPGLVLKIIRPQMALTLVESIGKKAAFCQAVVDELDLRDVQVLNLRAEDAGLLNAHRAQYDWAFARAVAAIPVLVEYLLPFLRVGGRMIAQKGTSAPAETEQAANALRILGGKVSQVLPVRLPGLLEDRYLVVVEKIRPTPAAYPRRAGVPAKTPLK